VRAPVVTTGLRVLASGAVSDGHAVGSRVRTVAAVVVGAVLVAAAVSDRRAVRGERRVRGLSTGAPDRHGATPGHPAVPLGVLVKLLIALDYLWERGPGYSVATADRGRFDLMLRSSDDNAASYFYQSDGREQSVRRMITRLGLANTAAPPTVGGGGLRRLAPSMSCDLPVCS